MKAGGIVLRSAPWLALALISVLVLVFNLRLSFDLSAFFPHQTSLTHDILLEQLKNGPGSRLMVAGIKGGSREQLAAVSEQMREQLAANPLFVNVMNGEFRDEGAGIPEPVNRYYLLLADIDYSRESLSGALEARLRDLAFGGGSALLDLIARDPFLISVDILQRLAPVNMSGDAWFAADGSAVLMAETRAAAVDLDAQARAIQAVREVFSNVSGVSSLELELTGVGAFGVELRQIIRAEAKKRSILASGALLLVLILSFRNLRFLFLASLPLAMGFLVGLALIALIFDTVHGITLAFGFTLLGIAVDFPLHLFSHSQRIVGSEAIRNIWPTMRLGAISTAIAYLAIALSGSSGLAQLGIFTAAGVSVAVLVTRSWLPALLPGPLPRQSADNSHPSQPRLLWWPAVLILALVLFAIQHLSSGGLWDDRLSSLSPVPESRLQADGALRSAASTPDMRYQLVLSASSLESLLRDSEAMDLLLEDARREGLLDGWQSVSQLLPSQQRQQDRRNAIPDQQTLGRNLREAIGDTPFRAEAFQPFEDNATSVKRYEPLTPSQFDNTPLSSWLDSHLVRIEDNWVALFTMNGLQPAELAERVSSWPMEVELVDLQDSTATLMRDYRNGAVRTIAIASLIIIAILLFQRGGTARSLWIVLSVTTALGVAVASVTALHEQLTIIHMVALLLVLGLGLDYALFLSRPETGPERRATHKAVLVCAISTTLAFGVLAGSSIPVLKFLGLTVACGSAASFTVAYVGSSLSGRRRRRP
jgi:predicted exporter